MSLDGFLTFFGLVFAGYAISDPITRLKIQIDAPLQWAIWWSAFIAIMAFEFIQPIIGALPETYALWVGNLEFGHPSDLLTNLHMAFLITAAWAIAAILLYKFSRPTTLKLKRLLPLVDRLQDENRALELVVLVEPYLPALERAHHRESKCAKFHDRLVYACVKEIPTARSLGNKRWGIPNFQRPLFKVLGAVTPSFQGRTDAATEIVDSLAKSLGVRKILQVSKPKFAAKFFSSFHGSHYQWLDKYIAESMENKDSHLRNDIRESDSTDGVTYVLSPENHVLFSLIADTKFATEVGVWSPVGDTVTKIMREDKFYQQRLNEAPPQNNDDLFEDITYSAIRFFDILITRTAVQGHMDHMSMNYLEKFVYGLVALPSSNAKAIVGGGEFASLKESLICEAQHRLSNWVELAKRLPEDNPHKKPATKQEAKRAVAIPYWAAETLCNVLRAVIMSETLRRDFKEERLISFVRTAARGLDPEVYLRELLAVGVMRGTWDVSQRDLSKEIGDMMPNLDATCLGEFPELRKALRPVPPN